MYFSYGVGGTSIIIDDPEKYRIAEVPDNKYPPNP
jgi:hypothetical protein